MHDEIDASMESRSRLGEGHRPFQFLFYSNPNLAVLSTFEEGRIVAANRAFFDFTGFEEQEVAGRTSIQLGLWPSATQREEYIGKLKESEHLSPHPLAIRTKSGEAHRSTVSSMAISFQSQLYIVFYAVLSNVPPVVRQGPRYSENGLFENTLRDKLDEILKYLKDSRNDRNSDAWESIAVSLEKNIFPFVEKLKKEKLGANSRTYLEMLEHGLKTLISSFPIASTWSHYGLTHTEIQVAELIKQSKSSKEIASLLHVSIAAIAFHRQNIRKKLGLNKRRANLIEYLNKSA